MEKTLEVAKTLTTKLANLSPKVKNSLLEKMSKDILKNKEEILKANEKDLKEAEKNSLPEALVERLKLDEDRILDMANSILEIAKLNEPLGRVLEGWVNSDGLRIEKVSIPIGVIGIIYESRPNVTADSAALCIKSGNIAILKGGKEAKHSNSIIAKTLQDSIKKFDLNPNIITLLEDREDVAKLIKQDKFVDLIIPRGGAKLIEYITKNSTVPVVKHDKGLCHIFIDKSANFNEAVKIVKNAKCQRPGVCNALETLLIHEEIAKDILPMVYEELKKEGCEFFGCENAQKIVKISSANEDSFHTEYLSKTLNIKIVKDVNEAIYHIQKYGSGHSDSILTYDLTNAELFLNSVDSSVVYLNASTRFTDGGVFGFGAEIGISTNKLHARGPMGINDLCTYKYKIYGSGQIRE
ncbi:MAG: glutamate-5-semialdehyde dehydrogenase [Sulfurospirillaceae bacterium]|nr:glutamate-5-semialdehyde dehydrogenase [Sulfurospirillaceae bacterium]